MQGVGRRVYDAGCRVLGLGFGFRGSGLGVLGKGSYRRTNDTFGTIRRDVLTYVFLEELKVEGGGWRVEGLAFSVYRDVLMPVWPVYV